MKHKLHVFLILISGAFWATSCLFIHEINLHTSLSSVQITAIRICVAALILNILLIIKGRGFSLYRVSLRSLLITAGSGVFSVFAMCMFYYRCITETSAAVAVILLYTAPIFVMFLSRILFRERLTLKKIIAFLFAIVGCALVSGVASGVKMNPIGVLFGLLGAFTYSLYGILTALFMKSNREPLTFTALNFIFAAIAALIVSNPAQIVQITLQSPVAPRLIVIYTALALCTAVIPFLLYAVGIKGVKPDTASILAFTEPITACLLGTFVLKEPMDLLGVLGIFCVCAAILILNVQFPSIQKRRSHSENSAALK
ncbi:MAG: hypothetical protein E7666_01740 [Ruminococcaceae bacterium]|nr:hypothetical protein [Oscillospiraceae bacterium]